MKKLITVLVVLALAVSLLAGCGKEAKYNSIAVCLASEPDTIDPALNSAVDGATLISHLFTGLTQWSQTKDGKLEITAAAAKELPKAEIGADGKATYVFQLKDGMKWSDGTDVTAADFVFAWKRAAATATASDYGYMFDVIEGYPDNLNVKASDDGKSITVVLNNDVAYFMELCAFPTYMPVKESVVANEKWATDPATYVGNGPYKMTEWAHNGKIVLEKNPDYFDAKSITMDKIEFYLSDDDGAMLANFQSGTWQFIDSVPNDEIKNLQTKYPEEFVVTGQLGTYYACFNVNANILPAGSTLTGNDKVRAEEEIRLALSLLIDRNYIVEQIGKAGQVPASSFVSAGLTDADGSQFADNAGGSKDYKGYFNVTAAAFEAGTASAVETLKKYYKYDEATKKFTDFPAIDYLYNKGSGHQAIAEYLQQAYAVYGISVSLAQQEWNTFLNTRKEGQYVMARNGWLADYNDPISYLDMWLTASGNNDIQMGKGNNEAVKAYSVDLTSLGYDLKVTNGTWAETYDAIIKLVKSETDTAKRYALMHAAEDLLMSTGCIVPIYFYTDIYMCSSKVKGFYSSPLGYKFFMHATIEG